MNIIIRQCNLDDLLVLQHIASKTYGETFGHLNTAECMETYLQQAFDLEKLKLEMLNAHSMFYFIYADNKLAGYMKTNDYKAQTDLFDEKALEIERIYVLHSFHKKGLGQLLINKGIETARQMKKAYVWLGVWEKNENAIAFYKKNGFKVIGTHTFQMGEEAQKDFVLSRQL